MDGRMPLGGVPASVAIFALRLVPQLRDTAAAHFLKTVSRQRVRPATPVYTRWHRLAPLGTDLHLLLKKIMKPNHCIKGSQAVLAHGPVLAYGHHAERGTFNAQHSTPNPAVAGQARNAGYPGKSDLIRPKNS
jgi:hypothetical protein